jgi:hypothetical protein
VSGLSYSVVILTRTWLLVIKGKSSYPAIIAGSTSGPGNSLYFAATMPTIPNPAEARLNNIRLSFTAAVDSFELLANSSNLPFLKPISVTARALLISVQVRCHNQLSLERPLTVFHQTVRNNKNECGRLMEQLHEVLYGIMHLHIKSDTGGQLPPSTLNHIRQFSE